MLEIFGNIWDLAPQYDAVVITTNGCVKKNGEAVMGRGIALEAKTRYPSLAKYLGEHLRENGNVPGISEIVPNVQIWESRGPRYLITLPVKPVFGPRGEPGWQARADIDLIRNSTLRMVAIVDGRGIKCIILPRPGCGNGKLRWDQVKPVIEPILDDRFTVVTYER